MIWRRCLVASLRLYVSAFPLLVPTGVFEVPCVFTIAFLGLPGLWRRSVDQNVVPFGAAVAASVGTVRMRLESWFPRDPRPPSDAGVPSGLEEWWPSYPFVWGICSGGVAEPTYVNSRW